MLEELQGYVAYKLNGNVPYQSFDAVCVRAQVVAGTSYIFTVSDAESDSAS